MIRFDINCILEGGGGGGGGGGGENLVVQPW